MSQSGGVLGAVVRNAPSGAVPASRLMELAKAARSRLPPLTRAELEDIGRAYLRGDQIDETTLIRIQMTPGAGDYLSTVGMVDEAVPPPSSALDVATDTAPRGEVQKVGANFVSANDPSIVLRKLDDEGDGSYVYPDGTVVDVFGNVKGKIDADATATDANLEASAVPLDDATKPVRGGARNLTPKMEKVDRVKELADQIWADTTPSVTEPRSKDTINRLLRESRKFRNPDGTYDPAFLAKFPNQEAAIKRLESLEEMSSATNAEMAARQIDLAAQARGVAGTPRPPSADRAAADAAMRAARERASQSLPAGDWDALTKAFNQLPAPQRQAVMASLPQETRRFLAEMLENSQTDPVFSPNLVAARTRPVEVDPLTPQPSAVAAPGPDTSAAEGLVDLAASRIAHQRRVMLEDYSDQIEAARGDKELIALLLEERDARTKEFDAILMDRDRLKGVALKQAEETALDQMAEIEAAAQAAESSGNAAQAAEMQRKLALTERNLEELRASFAATTNPSAGGRKSDEIALAARELNDRQQALTVLRNALLDQDEEFSTAKFQLQRASVPPPQPAAMTPGARTPVFAAEELPAQELPGGLPVAKALRAEADTRALLNTPGTGLSREVRLRAARDYLLHRLGVDPKVLEKMSDAELIEELPLFLKGYDGRRPFDSRRAGSRADYVSPSREEELRDIKGLEEAVTARLRELDAVEGVTEWRAGLQAADAALQKAERAAAKAAGGAGMARAKQKVDAARQAYMTALQSNPAAAAAMKAVDDAYEAVDSAGRGKTMGDKALNKAGPAETYSDVVAGMAGFKVPAAPSIQRSSVGLDPKDVKSLASEAGSVYGNRLDEAVEGAETADEAFTVSPNRRALAENAISISEAPTRKPKRLGGGASAARQVGSAQAMFNSPRFGPFNPLEMRHPDTGERLFPDADAVAREILSKEPGYGDETGSRAYSVARDNIRNVIERHYDDSRALQPSDAKFIPDPDDTVVLDDAAQIDNLEGSATPIGDTDPAVTETPKPKRGGRKKKGEAAAAEAAPAEAAPSMNPVTGRSMDDIQKEADEVEKEARKAARADGASAKEADKAARAARKKFVDEEIAAQPKMDPVATARPAATPAAADAPTAPEADAPKMDPVEVSGRDAVDDGDTPDVVPDRPAPTPDETPTPDDIRPATPDAPVTPATPAKPKRWLGRALLGVGAVGIGALGLDALTRRPNDGGVPPDGAGGGGGVAGPGGEVFPIPVGSDGATLMGEDARAAEEARLTRALDRIRGRATINKVPTFQTVQNYNGWR